MAVGDVYTLDVHSLYQNNPNVFCVQFFVTNDPSGGTIASDLLFWANFDLLPLLLPFHNGDVIFRCATTRQLYPNASVEELVTLNDTEGSNNAFEISNPGQLSLVVTLFGNKFAPTARNRGRDFWYGANADDMDTSGIRWSVTWQTQTIAFYTGIGNHIVGNNGGEYDIGIFSRTQANENDNPDAVGDDGIMNSDRPTFGDPVFNQLEFVRTDGLIRTQRRRQPEDPCAATTSADIVTVAP